MLICAGLRSVTRTAPFRRGFRGGIAVSGRVLRAPPVPPRRSSRRTVPPRRTYRHPPLLAHPELTLDTATACGNDHPLNHRHANRLGRSVQSLVMRRRIANIAAVTLLGVTVVLSVFWVRSHWRNDTVYRQATPEAWSIASNDGGLTLGLRNYDGLSLNDQEWRYRSGSVNGIGYGMRRWAFAGFARSDFQSTVGTGDLAYKFRDDYWTVPYWILVLVSSAYPAFWIVGCVRRRVARARVARGQCPSCGYDLRASPAQCPECGRLAAPAAA